MSDELENKIRDIADQVYDENKASEQFAVSNTSFHTHNNSDSPRINFNNLTNRSEFINFDLVGFLGQTDNNWGVIFTAPYNCAIIGATEVHQTAETTSTTLTVQVEKLTGTQASGSGITLLLNPFNLKATANTVQTAVLNQTTAKNGAFNLQVGDRIGLVLSRTGAVANTLVGVVIIIQLSY